MRKKFDYYERATGRAVLSGLGVSAVVTAAAAAAAFLAVPPDNLPASAALNFLKQQISGTSPPLNELGQWMSYLGGWKANLGEWKAYAIKSGAWADVVTRTKLLAGVAGITWFITAATMTKHCSWKLKDRWIQDTGVNLRPPPEGRNEAQSFYKKLMDELRSQLVLAPGVDLPWELEVLGILITGAPGTGKTQIIKFLLSQLVRRTNTRLVVLDAGKGDMISGWPDEDFALLSPADDRVNAGPGSMPQAMAWDIARDLLDVQDAREFAARVIPDSGNDTSWTQGARLVVVAILRGLMEEYGQNWNWRDLYQSVTMSDQDLHDWVEKYSPEALTYVAIDDKGNFTKNAMSFVNQFKSTMLIITEPLAHAWGDVPQHRRISMRQWLIHGTNIDGSPAPRTILLGRSGRMSTMSSAWIGSLFRMFSAIVKDTELAEDLNRRVLFVLDEFPTIAAKGDGIGDFKEFGRSKGIGVIIGVQSLQQLIRAWGGEEFSTFDETVETKIFGKTKKTLDQGTGARAMAEMVGKGDFKRRKPKKKDQPEEWEDKERLIVKPEFFEGNLGKHKDGLRAALMLPDDLCVIDWPYTSWPETRRAVVAPRWVKSLSSIAKKGVTAKDPWGVVGSPDDGRISFCGRVARGWRAGAEEGFVGRIGGLFHEFSGGN